MKKFFSLTLTLAAMLSAMAVSAQAADYSFETDGTPEYYPSSSYEDVYGSRYNYGGKNVVDYQIPELEYGQLSTTQTGVMEKIMLPGLQGISASGGGIYGISPGGGTVEIPGFLQGGSTATPATPAFTELTQDFLLSNGAVGKISIPAIGVKNYYLWEGETTASMKKGLGHFTSTSVWNGNVAVCGHNRGAKYVIGSIKDLDVGDKITYTTSMGTRTYLVETVTKISSSDWSYLSSTTDNRMTLLMPSTKTLERRLWWSIPTTHRLSTSTTRLWSCHRSSIVRTKAYRENSGGRAGITGAAAAFYFAPAWDYLWKPDG